MLAQANAFTIREAILTDLEALLELEKEWPLDVRASKEILSFRINKFPQGFLIAENTSGIIASIICCPYFYSVDDISYFKNWETVVQQGYERDQSSSNALYIVSGTTKQNPYGNVLFAAGIQKVFELANLMKVQYLIAGCLLPGYRKYIQKNGFIEAADYVFKKTQSRFIDPLIEKYRRLGFIIPDKKHVIANYFPDESSLNYSALAVRKLENF